MHQLLQFDQDFFLALNGIHNSYWDVVMSILTGKIYWVVLYLTIVWFIAKNFKLRIILIFLILALAIVVSDQFSSFIKDTVQRYRPTHEPAIQNLVHFVKNKGGFYGFFSSHAANTFTVAMFTSLLFRNKRYSIMIFLWASVVSYTRIYLGLHYPFDIFTGLAFGLLVGFGAYKFLGCFEKYFPILNKDRIKLSNPDFGYIFLVLIVMISVTLFVSKEIFEY